MSNSTHHIDESPIRFDRLVQSLPNWLQRFLPIGGGLAHDHHGKGMFGVAIFLLSESLVFLSFFFTYIALRLTHPDWIPPGIKGPELSSAILINSVILLSSSFVIQAAENALRQHKIIKFRWLWLLTSGMGAYFLVGQAIEWSNLDFQLTTGLMGATFYLLTGFHGLHVLTGICLQLLMLFRSFLRGNYQQGHFGVSSTTLFWHFVDVIWIILFALVYIW